MPASSLSRARQTCALAGYAQRAEERVELLEWDDGAYQGLTAQQVRAARPDWALWRDGCPGGETAAAVGVRVDRLLDEVAKVPGNVLLVAHGHLLRVVARGGWDFRRRPARGWPLHRLRQRAGRGTGDRSPLELE